MTTRREFLKTSAAFCCTVGLLSLEGCTSYRSVQAEEENGKLKIKKSEFLQGGDWAMVRTPRANAPIFLSKDQNEKFSAVLMLCTHKQCEIKPSGPALVCPCHGAEFSYSGKVLKEPAEQDLMRYATSSDENHIYIHLK